MKTEVRKQSGHFNLCDREDYEEIYTLIFGQDESEKIYFSYKEDQGIEVRDRLPEVILDDLENTEPIKYLFSSKFNHIGEKSLEERVALGRKLAERNRVEDVGSLKAVLLRKADKLTEQANQL